MKQLRKLQPDVMFRARGIGNYGDYYTPEGFVPGAKENTAMPWMVIYQLGGMWSYQPDATKYKGAAWIITNLVDVVAKGGNFMVGIGPDARGRFIPRRLKPSRRPVPGWSSMARPSTTPARARTTFGRRGHHSVHPDQGPTLCLCPLPEMARLNSHAAFGPSQGRLARHLAGHGGTPNVDL